jgi:hypothetical protein
VANELPLPVSYLPAQDPLGHAGFGGGAVTLGSAEVAFAGAEATFGGSLTEVDGGEMETDPVLLAGTTGEICFTAPPTTLDLVFGPPTAFCAKAGLANAQSTRTDMTAPLFIDDFPFTSCRQTKIPPNRANDKHCREVINASRIDFPYRFVAVFGMKGTKLFYSG